MSNKLRQDPLIIDTLGFTSYFEDLLNINRIWWTGGTTGGHALIIHETRRKLADTKFLKTVNDGGTYTDYSSEVLDSDLATEAVLSSLDTVANGDWVLIGHDLPFEGIWVDMSAEVNAVGSVLSAHYWNGTAWVAVSALVDGTASAGATFAVDGAVTFDMPSNWVPTDYNLIHKYWIRLSVSVALSADVQIDEIRLLGKKMLQALCPGANLDVEFWIEKIFRNGMIVTRLQSGTLFVYLRD